MLDENEIVSILCSHLEGEGASILEKRSTIETGIDVVCRTRDGRTLHIEAKGGTSSRRGSPRYSKPFTRTQVFDRVAKGTYTAIAARNPGVVSCFAFPDEPVFLGYVEQVSSALRQLGVVLFAVSEHGVREIVSA